MKYLGQKNKIKYNKIIIIKIKIITAVHLYSAIKSVDIEAAITLQQIKIKQNCIPFYFISGICTCAIKYPATEYVGVARVNHRVTAGLAYSTS